MTGQNPVFQWIDAADGRKLTEEWSALAKRTAACAYMTPVWFECWVRHFAKGRRVSLLTVRRDGILTGVLPICVDRVGLFRVARLAGTDPHCIVLRLAIEAADQPLLLAEAARQLLRKEKVDAVSFTPISGIAGFRDDLNALQTPGEIAVVTQPSGSHVVFDLPDTFEAFLTRLSKKRRAQYRRDVKGLTKTFGLSSSQRVPDGAAFGAFVAFHNLQWQAIGKGGHFADWPGSAAFYADLADQSNTPIRFFEDKGDSLALSTQFGLLSPATCHWRLPARTLEPEAERLSVGKVGLLSMIRDLIDAGITTVEAGAGEYGYKLSYGGRDESLERVIVIRDRAVAKLRLKLLLAYADLLDLAFYRIWFKRLAPKLRALMGGSPKPLWRSWIRARV